MKRQLIYKEVLAMLNSGAEYKAITLSEVAKRCNIGKSTIYDYFNSKDEMIFNSLIYYINKMLKFFSQGFKVKNYENSLKVYIKALIVCMNANYWMVFPWTFNSYKNYLTQDDAATVEDLLAKSQNIMIALLTSICKSGKKEGVIATTNAKSIKFAYFAIIGQLSEVLNQEDFDVGSDEGKQFVQDLMDSVKKQLS